MKLPKGPQKNSALTATIRVGAVLIRPWKEGRVQLDYRLPDGKHARPIIPAIDEISARKAATRVARALESLFDGDNTEHPDSIVLKLQGKGESSSVGLSITEALEEGIREGSRAGDEQKKELRRYANMFIEWLVETYPSDTPNQWNVLSHRIIQKYANSLAGKASDTIKHRLAPVRLAARYWQLEDADRYPDFTTGVRLPVCRQSRKAVSLKPEQLTLFLDAVATFAPALFPLATLSAYSGLRILEAAHLRICDYDREKGQITITKAGGHRPKNAGSYRTVPVAALVQDLLNGHLDSAGEVDSRSPIFTTVTGVLWNKDNIGCAWERFKKALKTARDAGRTCYEIPKGYSIRNGRATFITTARKGGAGRSLIKAYVGHSANDMLGRYDVVDIADLQAVVTAFELGIRCNAETMTIEEGP